MANQIQGTVYQIDGSPLSAPIQVAFLTSNISIRQFTTALIPQVNASITYYPNVSNQLQEQTFLVSETIATLVSAANTNGTTQVSATVLEINQEPQLPSGITFSFPAQGISIWPVAVPVVGGVNSFLEFKNKKYYLLESKATLVAAANAGGGGGGTSTGVNGLNGTTNIGLGGTLLNDTNIDANNFELSFLEIKNLIIEDTTLASLIDLNANGIKLTNGNAGYWTTNGTCAIGDVVAGLFQLQLDTANNKISGAYNGTLDIGINLDYQNQNYTIGDTSKYWFNAYCITGGAMGLYSNDFYIQIIDTDGIQLRDNSSDNIFFMDKTQLFIISDTVSILNFSGDNLNIGNSSTKFNFNGGTGINDITAYDLNNGIENGIKLDYQNQTYLFGDYNSSNNFLLISTSNVLLSGYGVGFLGNGFISKIGDIGSYQNSTTFGIDDTNQTLIATGNLSVGTSGGASGVHLKINVGGTDYVIQLLNP